MKRARLIRIAAKSLLRRNRGNQLFFGCIVLLLLIPTLLLNTTQSVLDQVAAMHKTVFGSFTDIYYQSDPGEPLSLEFTSDDMAGILPGFHYDQYGVLSSVFEMTLENNKKLIAGYADREAQLLGEITVLTGSMPIQDHEVALTEGLAAWLGNKAVGDTVEIIESSYKVTGIIQNYGYQWPRSEKQIRQKTAPINAFVTGPAADHMMQSSGKLSRQILIVRQLGVSNLSESSEDFIYNTNNTLKNSKTFTVPTEFIALVVLVSLISLMMILALNRRRLTTRLKNYYYQGLRADQIRFIARFELFFLFLSGALVGIALGCGLSFLAVNLVSQANGQFIPVSINWISTLVLLSVTLLGVCIMIFFFIKTVIRQALSEQVTVPVKHWPAKKKWRLSGFVLKTSLRSNIFLLLLIVCSFSLIAYGILFANLFTINTNQQDKSKLPRDYDFQYTSSPLPGPQSDGSEPVVYFTDTYEKLGADASFIDRLLAIPEVKAVKAYREANKYNVLLKANQIDDYIDGGDFSLDGSSDLTFVTGINDFQMMQDLFGYQPDDMLVGSEILSYPLDDLQSFAGFVVEGEINLEKIAAGDEVVLRVPAYILEDIGTGNFSGTMMSNVPHEQAGALNSTTFKVGDTIHLSGILTDEMINGSVLKDQLGSFYRKDLTVKVGAIIRDASGFFSSPGSRGRSFSILTLDSGFDAMEISATYSNIHIYTRDGYTSAALSKAIADTSNAVPFMLLEDLQMDLKTFKSYNLMINTFVATLLIVLVLTTLFIMTNQLLIRTQLSMKNYALLRINGVSYAKTIGLWVAQVVAAVVFGCVIGIPISLLSFHVFGVKADFRVVEQILYYFPLINFLYLGISMVILAAISALPSLLYLRKHRDDVLFDL